MYFAASTLLMLASLTQAQNYVNRVIGPGDTDQAPYIFGPASMSTSDDPTGPPPLPPYQRGVLTSFTVIEGTGCPAGTFTPQPIEPGKSNNTYVDWDNFFYNSTTSEGPATCTLKFDYEFIYPEGEDYLIPLEISTDTKGDYEEGDEERTTSFNLYHEFTVDVDGYTHPTYALTWNVFTDKPSNLNMAAQMPLRGVPGEKGVGSFQVHLAMYVDGLGEMRASRTRIGFWLFEYEE